MPAAMSASSRPSRRSTLVALADRMMPAPIRENAGACSKTRTVEPARCRKPAAHKPPRPAPMTATRCFRPTPSMRGLSFALDAVEAEPLHHRLVGDAQQERVLGGFVAMRQPGPRGGDHATAPREAL